MATVNRQKDRQSGGGIVADDDDNEFDNIITEVNRHGSSTVEHGATGAVVGTTNTQSLSNKTITGGTITTTDIGARTIGWVENLAVTYASSTLTITGYDGTALSSTNVGYVGMPSTTSGRMVPMPVSVATHFFIDDGGASDIIGEQFGVTTGVAWANPRPFFLYACMEDADAGVKFAISPNPCAKVVPATANIGYHATPATTPSDNNFFFLNATDPTTAYDGNPCVKIGAINMVMSTSDDWTVQALATVPSGIGPDKLAAHFSTTWTFPMGQMGNDSGKPFTTASPPTALAFTTYDAYYTINDNGVVVYNLSCANRTATGADSTALRLYLPCPPESMTRRYQTLSGGYLVAASWGEYVLNAWIYEGNAYASLMAGSDFSIFDSTFAIAGDLIYISVSYTRAR